MVTVLHWKWHANGFVPSSKCFGGYKTVKFTGKPIQIDDPTVNTLCPTVSIYGNLSVEANFGDDSTKPFKCDLVKCAAEIFFE
jgi:hypothetical protein